MDDLAIMDDLDLVRAIPGAAVEVAIPYGVGSARHPTRSPAQLLTGLRESETSQEARR